MKDREKKRKEAFFDQVDEEELQQEIGLEDSMCLDAVNIVTQLVETYKDDFVAILNDHVQSLHDILANPESSEKMRRTALFVFDDVVENLTPARIMDHVRHLMPEVLKSCLHPSCEVRQAAFYGLGVMALRFSPAEFTPFAQPVVDVCVAECRAQRDTTDASTNAARDNAISA